LDGWQRGLDDEHIIPLKLEGSNDLSNREPWCVPCAKAKTRADRKAISEVARPRRQAGEEGASRRSDPAAFRETRCPPTDVRNMLRNGLRQK